MEAPSISPFRFSYRAGSVFGLGVIVVPAPGSMSERVGEQGQGREWHMNQLLKRSESDMVIDD